MTDEFFDEYEDDEEFEMYCRVCGSCGEDGCCPPWKCKHEKGCLYPETENGLFTKFCRFLAKIFHYKAVDNFYNWVLDLPFNLKRILICNIIGHKYDETNYYRWCSRCFSVDRKGKKWTLKK